MLSILHTNFCISGKDIRPINKLFFSVGFYDTGEEELPDYQPDFKKLRQDHLDGKMRDDIEQVIYSNSLTLYLTFSASTTLIYSLVGKYLF